MGSVLVIEGNEGLRRELLLGFRGHDIDAEAVAEIAAAIPLVHSERVDVVLLGPGLGSAPEALETLAAAAWPDRTADTDFENPATAGASVAGPDVLVLLGADAELRRQNLPDTMQQGLRALQQGAADFVLASQGAEGVALAVLKLRARRSGRGRRGPGPEPGVEFERGVEKARRTEQGRSVPPGGGATRGPDPQLALSAVSPAGLPAVLPAMPVLVGSSPKITSVLKLITRLAGVRTGVLVGGESGTGKELVARALHLQSPWRGGPFVAVNCGAIPAGLIESELFGHVRGSFTDAVRDKQGLFQAAHGGTLFLDEIADLPLALQPKLLRALQDGVVRRVGDSEDVQVSVRVVAATARDLAGEVAARRFREDLYYRLAGLTIHLPPLRERREDIPVLAMHFLERARSRLGVAVREIDPEALRLLVEYRWPGNVRELENTIERAAVLCSANCVDVASLPERMVPAGSGADGVPAASGGAAGGGASAVAARTSDPGAEAGAGAGRPGGNDVQGDNGNMSIKQANRRSEEELIIKALGVTGGNRTRAAELLEISHRALLYKIKEYGITVASRREAIAAAAAGSGGKLGGKLPG